MKNIEAHIIHEHAPIKKALAQLNKLSEAQTLTLFVVNDNKQLIGTLTDGDIRRGFVNDRSLEDRVGQFASKSFYYIDNGIDVNRVSELKNKGIRLLPVLNFHKQIEKVYDLHKLNSVLPVDAVIMAGGRGSRLRPLTDTIPKPMLQLGGKPIIEHTIDRLISYGIEKIYISVHYLKEQIIAFFGDGTSKGIQIQYIEEDEPLGTVGALSLVEDYKNDILLTNSDLFSNIDYEDFYLTFEKHKADMAIASLPYTVNIPYAILEEDKNKITSFKEKPSNTHYANAGIYLIKKELIRAIPKNEFYNTTDLMQYVIDSGKKIIHNPIVGYWIDIGKHEDLKRAQEILKHS